VLTGKRLGTRQVIALALLQVLAVNFHGYFLLGVALTGAVAADRLIRWVWARGTDPAEAGEAAGRLRWAGIAVAAVATACLLNPWHVRGAVMPIRTVAFLQAHGIGGSIPETGGIHPWSTIGEFLGPLNEGLQRTWTTRAFLALMALGWLGGLVALLRRRWAELLVIAGMLLIALRMRRNIGPAAVIVIPTAMAVLWEARLFLTGPVRKAGLARGALAAGVFVSLASAAAGAVLAAAVVRQDFYVAEGRHWRFGTGLSPTALPLSAADWLREHPPDGRVFCDYDTSSNLLYFGGDAVEAVPVLTNTWAYPPYVMQWVLQCVGGVADFEKVAREHGVTAVVLRTAPVPGPLIRSLAADDGWSLVHLGPRHLVFVRAGATAPGGPEPITPMNFDPGAFADRVAASDPVPSRSLHRAGFMLRQLAYGRRSPPGGGSVRFPDPARLTREIAWTGHATAVLRRAIEVEPDFAAAHAELGVCLRLAGTSKLLLAEAFRRQGRPETAQKLGDSATLDWSLARRHLERALELDPDNEYATANLAQLEEQMAGLRDGRILVPGAG
jgi:hypothetical protein